MKPTYFTCTLGEAKLWKERNPDAPKFKDVIDLIDQQASRMPNAPAAGFADFQNLKQGQPRFLTFAELAKQSINASHILKAQVGGRRESEDGPETVGLLCSSSFEFLLVFLGLLRLRYSVLFLAPQLEPKAIKHLCATLGVETIYTDDKQESRLTTVKDSIRVLKVPSHDNLDTSSSDQTNGINSERLELPDVAYWCHTSGTSSGLPKPIPQTHAGVVAALPSFADDASATYTTTPLYHGGIVDGYRAWTSGAMIWYFPEGTAPITSDSVTRSVRVARGTKAGNVRYFSSVPYILQLLADDEEGLKMIQSMELVGVGGAALPESVGNRLVDQGVHLLSRMGSAECGFLMSSHRDYSADKKWQYLRPVQDENLMAFERQGGDGLSELVVKAGWPFLAKTNRPDGSFATSDLFEPLNGDHNCGIWRYHSRSDAQITLSNGKKFDPAPMEAALVASTGLIKDALIFGAGRGYPGALLVPSPGVSCDGFIDRIWRSIQAINQESQNHSRLSKSMLLVVDPTSENAVFEKSSKGTLLRRTVEERFAMRISDAYENAVSRPKLPESASYEDLCKAVRECFDNVLGKEVKPDADLFLQGVDSLSCMQIRGMVQASCLPSNGPSLPLNVVYDQSTLRGLVDYVWHLRQGQSAPDQRAVEEAQLEAMKKMTEELTITDEAFLDSTPISERKEQKSVVLTGATGLLGGWILKHLVDDESVTTVSCLIRAPDEATARDRALKSLKNRGLAELLNDKVQCLPSDLAEQDCGLSAKQRDELLATATLVIHSAWAVNFNLSLPSFRDQVIGTANLLRLSRQAKARFVFISSTAAVSNKGSSPVTETVSTDPFDASPLGYSRSKWVAEQICAAAAESASAAPRDRGRSPVTVVRVGQLCGDLNGSWNASEAYPLMLSTARLIGCLPNIPHESTNWVPVHLAARAVLDIADSTRADDGGDGGLPVYHVANPHRTPTWEQMLDWISETEASSSFEKVAPADWVAKLEEASRQPGASHPSFALLELWKTAYGTVSGDKSGSSKTLSFDIARSKGVSSTMKALQPLSREELLKMWQWARNAIR